MFYLGGPSGHNIPPRRTPRPTRPPIVQHTTPRSRPSVTDKTKVPGAINPCEHAFEAIAVLRQEVFLFMGQVRRHFYSHLLNLDYWILLTFILDIKMHDHMDIMSI